MNYDFAQMFQASRWLIEPSALKAMIKQAAVATPDAVAVAVKAYGERSDRGLTLVGDVAVINISGPITYRPSIFSFFFGGSTIEGLQQQVQSALADPAVKTILFRCDSPGGVVDMVPEFADELYAARGQKPMIAVADTCICSAAYWLACQADTVYASASSVLGSIGVYMEHEEVSGMLEQAGIKVTLIQHGDNKTAGNPYEPLSDRAKATIQALVDEVGNEFDASVARARGVTKRDVLDTFGQGDVFRGRQAIAKGLADKQGTFAQVLARLTKGRASGVRAADDARSVLAAQADDVPVLLAAKTDKADRADTVEPEDGECPDGYEMGKDGMCHMMPAEAQKDTAEAEALAMAAEHEAIGVALTR